MPEARELVMKEGRAKEGRGEGTKEREEARELIMKEGVEDEGRKGRRNEGRTARKK